MKAVRRCVNLTRPVFRHLRTSSCSQNQSIITQDNIVKSPLPPVPVPNQNIEEFLFDRVEKWVDKTAVVCADTGRTFTYAQYLKMTENVAQALCAQLGFKKGDVLAVLLPNVPEYVTIFTAAFRAGIILTTINPIYTADEIAKQLNDCSAKALITLAETINIAQEALKKLHTNENVPIITVKRQQSESTPEGTINFHELCEYNGRTVRLESPSPEELALLPYSSGTSGLPKGVMLKHRNVVADLVQIQQENLRFNHGTTKDYQDVVPIMAPLFHCYGMIPILFNMFSEGCINVLMSKYRPDLYLEMLERYPPNILHLVPPIVIMLINNENAKRHHLRRTRNIISAAAPLADTDIVRFTEKFGSHIKLSQCYGLTETGPVSHAQRLDVEIINGSVGCNLSLIETRVVAVDDDTKNLGPNQNGHLLIRGPQVMPGYHNNENATRDAIDADGWFKTGDVAYYTQDGSFFITDRIKELIKVKGFQVAPAELEALIRDHPDVDDVAVTSIPHEQHGEAPRAYVVPRRGTKVKPEYIQRYVQERAAKHKHLTGGVVFIESVPKNPSGKILRRLLKGM